MDAELTPFVSIIIPCRNEEKFILSSIESLVNHGGYPTERLEVIIADGMSTDNTRETIELVRKRNTNLRIIVVDNPKKVTPCGLNLAIEKSTGEIILRADAHSVYPKDYIRELVKALYIHNADNSGGVQYATAANHSSKAIGIAGAISSKLGVGSSHRNAEMDSEPRITDTVPYGCFRREVFNRLGLFDERFIRSQDEEMNYRITKSGGRIVILPYLRIAYFVRESIKKLFWMFFQYGFGKASFFCKHRTLPSARQKLFFALVFSFIVMFVIGLFLPPVLMVTAIVFALYTAMCFLYSGLRGQNIGTIFWMGVSHLVIHLAYATGFFIGLIMRGNQSWLSNRLSR